MDRVLVQEQDFDLAKEYALLGESSSIGAVVTFVGKVRDFNLGDNVVGLHLQHYPQMTEKALHEICNEARARWPLDKVTVIHRVGDLDIADQIVLVGVSSAHRDAAFSACEFIMDYLKTKAPFWKKERLTNASRWIESRESDQESMQRW
ncbi:molybdopterin synthase catalytic subunit [Vibrio halioticoli NBRC 102217]|uniref:Molybdopterin synthase catalytic subunit n=1 Tax=Vibrio halioticoli NBRC 102217 TaxID=1219072 RepID=V5HPY5_9VIBR|nr:molybdopterin synthase catalytic subunit MoaE [Vibrio halioticoli]GAD91315.1 molybdopterin synthase catalytic subunit [Vibrio halioticoli NBRC 102217]